MQITFRQNEIELKPSLYRDRLSQLLQSDLDFRGKSSTYSSHAIHAFPAKFPPQIPRAFIENLTAPGEIVLDPMMGSGTTLLEAAMLNRRAVGIDIDPLALRISHTKLNPNQVDILKEAGEQAAANAQNKLRENPASLLEKLHSRFNAENLEFINYWFLPATQLELLALLEEIESIQNDTVRSFLLLNFSAIIITKSGGVSLALDLAHTRPHRSMSKPIKPAIPEFRKRLKKNLQNITDHRVEEFEQYEHLADLSRTLSTLKELRATLGDYIIKPDIVIGRQPVHDEEINPLQQKRNFHGTRTRPQN